MFYSPSLKLGRRDSISVGEMAAEKKEANVRQRATARRFWGKKMGENKKRSGGEIIEGIERELSQIESVCLGWY